MGGPLENPKNVSNNLDETHIQTIWIRRQATLMVLNIHDQSVLWLLIFWWLTTVFRWCEYISIYNNLLPKYLRLLRSLMPKRLLDCKPRWGRSSRQKRLTGQVSPRVWAMGGVEITSILVGAQQMIRLYFEDIVGSCRLRPCLIGIQQSHKPCMRLTMSIKSNSCTVVRKTFAVSLPPLACVD